jgi:hypothetical protein
MELRSDAFENNGLIPSQYTCDGDNVNPSLEILQIPEGTKSLSLIMDDPDSMKATGKIWDHWVVFNMSPDTIKIEEGNEPQGILGVNSFGNRGYGGACPSDGEHSYIFRVYALDTELDLVDGATKEQVEEFMKDHIIETAELIGRYERQQ